MKAKNNEPQVTPLRIYNPGDKDGEYFNLDSIFLLTLESFNTRTQVLHHAMAAPGFYLPRSGVLSAQYRPDIRPLHRHALMELMYVISGEVVQYIEDDRRIYRTGECCILNKNIRHVESYSSDFEAVFLLISDDYLKRLMQEDVCYRTYLDRRSQRSPLYRQLQQLLEESAVFQKTYLDFRPLSDPQLLSRQAEELFTWILQETLEQKQGYLNLVSGLICRLFALLSQESCYRMERINMRSGREDYIYNRIKLYLRQNQGRLDYDELEQLMHYTRDYLNRIVKHRSGHTLGKLAQRICLEEAARQLARTNRPISEIIYSLNYTNRTYFYRIFQEKYGMTPKEYRDSHNPAMASMPNPGPP